MKLRYKARTKEGQLQVGYVEAISREIALNMLAEHELYVLSLDEAKDGKWYERALSVLNRVRTKDMMVFTRQFSALLSAEIPLGDALRTLQRQTRNVTLKEILFEVSSDIDSGLSLSQALEKHPTVFSAFFVNMVRSAEVTGKMEEAISFLADYIEKQARLSSKVTSALIYPAFMIVAFVIAAAVMLIVFIPSMRPLFEEAGIELPLFTRILLGMSDVLADWWFAIVAGIGLIIFIAVDYFRSEEGRTVLDELSLRIPGVGHLLREMYVARLTESVSVLLRGGIPVAQAIEIAGQTMGSVVYKDVLHTVAEDVRRGELLSRSFESHPDFFPPMVSQMIAIGETTGRLDDLLRRVADFYMQEVDRLVNNLVELVQPILIIAIGGLVALLFASMLKPIYELVRSFA